MKLITHRDLDGVGCAVLAKKFLNISDIVYCTYDNIDETIKNTDPKQTIIITDICPSQDVCKNFNKFDDLILIDHHKTKIWLNKYKWAIFDQSKCGTWLFSEWLLKNHVLEDDVINFCEAINAWDLWKLDSPYRTRGENLNNLLRFIGFDEFVDKFSKDIKADINQFSELISILDKRKIRFIKETVDKQLPQAMMRKDGKGRKYKILVVNEYVSEIGEEVLTRDKEIDYVVMLSWNKCFLRSKKVDVSRIAKNLGGGGHAGAAGFIYNSRSKIESYIQRLLISGRSRRTTGVSNSNRSRRSVQSGNNDRNAS